MLTVGLLVAAQMLLCQETAPVYAHIRGRLLDAESERPLQGFVVQAYQRGSWGAVDSGISDANGEYDVSGLKPGAYAVLIEAPEAATVSVVKPGNKPLRSGYGKFFFPEADSIDGALQLTLAAGERRQLDIQLHRKELSRLVGKIAVIGDSPEKIVLDGLRILGPKSFAKAFSGAADQAGEFYVDGLPAGNYLVNARGVTPHGAKVIGAARVTVAANDTVALNVVMQPGILLRGTVRIEGGSVSPQGLRVHFIHSDLTQFDRNVAPVDEKGAFETAGVALGDYRVLVTGLPTGYEVLHPLVEIRSSNLDIVIVRMPRDETPTGR